MSKRTNPNPEKTTPLSKKRRRSLNPFQQGGIVEEDVRSCSVKLTSLQVEMHSVQQAPSGSIFTSPKILQALQARSPQSTGTKAIDKDQEKAPNTPNKTKPPSTPVSTPSKPRIEYKAKEPQPAQKTTSQPGPAATTMTTTTTTTQPSKFAGSEAKLAPTHPPTRTNNTTIATRTAPRQVVADSPTGRGVFQSPLKQPVPRRVTQTTTQTQYADSAFVPQSLRTTATRTMPTPVLKTTAAYIAPGCHHFYTLAHLSLAKNEPNKPVPIKAAPKQTAVPPKPTSAPPKQASAPPKKAPAPSRLSTNQKRLLILVMAPVMLYVSLQLVNAILYAQLYHL